MSDLGGPTSIRPFENTLCFTIAMRMRINSKDFVVGIFNRCILYDTKGSISYGYGRKQLYC